jgi:NAD(P)-dependent dehydrogenase (short-subunit alcohol dehydrogenase family)
MPKPVKGENYLPPKGQLSVSSLFGVQGKVCVVTGGGSGIGAMIAAGYCANGATVYITSRKDTSEFAKELTSRGPGTCVALRGDLAKEEGVTTLLENLTRLEPSGIHVLFNNAGTNWSEPLEEYSLKGWDRVYDLNVRAVFHVTQKLTPLLAKAATHSEPSRVINVSSIDAESVTALPTFAYSSGKAAVIRLTKVMAGHLVNRNITCNAILPGAFPSRMMRGTMAAAGDAMAKTIPRGRVGDIKDMAGACLFLGSRASAWMTGTTVVVDGGALMKVDPRTMPHYGNAKL